MEYRNLGKSGVKVSLMGLGCLPFGTWIDETMVQKVVDRALENGINFFDTADVYSQGISESMLGKAIKGKRNEVVIATKFGLRVSKDASAQSNPNNKGASRYYIMQAIDASLKRLQTDYIDLYQVHYPDPTVPIEETMSALNDLVHMGKVRYIGCSNFSAYQLSQAVETANRLNMESFVTAQDRYNLLTRRIESELVPCYKKYNLGLIPFSPLHGGFLTGIFQRSKGIPEGSRFAVKPDQITAEQKDNLLSERNFDLLEKLTDYARQCGHSILELAIAWLAANKLVCSIIAGIDTPEQIDVNLKGIEWKLGDEDLVIINRLLNGE